MIKRYKREELGLVNTEYVDGKYVILEHPEGEFVEYTDHMRLIESIRDRISKIEPLIIRGEKVVHDNTLTINVDDFNTSINMIFDWEISRFDKPKSSVRS